MCMEEVQMGNLWAGGPSIRMFIQRIIIGFSGEVSDKKEENAISERAATLLFKEREITYCPQLE